MMLIGICGSLDIYMGRNRNMTKTELRQRARGIAEGFVYSDEECECPWEPFESLSDGAVKQVCRDLEQTVYHALLWAAKQD
jgi:hypothetical protein